MAIRKLPTSNKIPSIDLYDCKGRENNTVVADLDGTLLIQPSSFPYFALVAFDVGGILRLILLLLASPIAGFLYYFVSESAGIYVLIFVTFAGVRVSAIESAAAAVLPKHYSEDLHPDTWRVFSSCGTKCVATANPRIMVEPFLKNYLGVDVVLGTEIMSYKGIATGFVSSPGVLAGKTKAIAVREAFALKSMPDIGIGDRKTDLPFMKLCKERYIVPSMLNIKPVPTDMLPRPVIFHDGRLVQKPTPLKALSIVLWFPVALVLGVLRAFVGSACPITVVYYIVWLFGCPYTTKGTPPDMKHSPNGRGVVFVCSHRTVLDGVYVSGVMRQMTVNLSYSISHFTEFLAPVKTARLTRDRLKDAKLINKILGEGEHVVIFPEGTTCREPYLLRFSSLFAELTDEIVPVAISVTTSMFHATTARGYKWLDPFFFFMNPIPKYEITFLDKLSLDQTCNACNAGISSHDVANNVQKMIAKTLNYKCTSLTRRDKYQELVGTDGLVGQKPTLSGAKIVSH